MGRHCGFSFYKFVDGKLEEANVVINPWLDNENELCNWLQIDGRCDATRIFLNLVKAKEIDKEYGEERKAEEKYTAYLLLNHPELDGYEECWKPSEHLSEEYKDWFDKYFYVGLETFKSYFDFKEAQKTHDKWVESYKKEILKCEKEIESLRTHQEKAQTKAVFDGFENNINNLKENISSAEETIHELEENDYDYNHFMIIEGYIKKVEKVIAEHPDVVVIAWAND